MKLRKVLGILGSFLQIYSLLLVLPVAIGIIYNESLFNLAIFAIASLFSAVIGLFMRYSGTTGDPSVREAIVATVTGWVLAVLIGAIPIFPYTSLVNSVFEAMAGLTTTGISMFLHPSNLPNSVLFWRSFMQWLGGLGILTFFIAVIRESGGISQRLFSAEAHKTDAGSIRPSLTKSIVDLWRVYGLVTSIIIVTYVSLGMDFFNAVNHAFTVLSTGGFSTSAESMAAFSPTIQAVTVFFMFIGGMNFVLLYMILRADWRPILKNTEFKTYLFFFVAVAALASYELFISMSLAESILHGSFQAISLFSSTGYATVGVMEFPRPFLVLFLFVMFVGGSLGSTAGGLKIFRIITMFKLLKTRLKSYSLPKSAINKVKVDGEILTDDSVKTISVLLFAWLSFAFSSSLLIVAIENITFMEAASAAISAAGSMGPMYISGETLVAFSPISKIIMIVGMLAGRLEMLPLLAIFNREAIKH